MFEHNSNVLTALSSRKDNVAAYWFSSPDNRAVISEALQGLRVLVVDAEDEFTQMLTCQLRSLGLLVSVRSYDMPDVLMGNWDCVVLGPGPGNPCVGDDYKMMILTQLLESVLGSGVPLFAICLSHQLLSLHLGLNVVKKDKPSQGEQSIIQYFGKAEYVGFYNTFIAKCSNRDEKALRQKNVTVCYDAVTHDVHALRGDNFHSLQFHPESILTKNGISIIEACLESILVKEQVV